jgi:hypothetical protein
MEDGLKLNFSYYTYDNIIITSFYLNDKKCKETNKILNSTISQASTRSHSSL